MAIFSPFEWIVATRYLRSRRSSGSVSVIAGFSFLGIMLGVATLIVVMSVMNGFRRDLLDKIVGVNGHIFVKPAYTPLTDYNLVVRQTEKVPGVDFAIPIIERGASSSSSFDPYGIPTLVRGIRESDIKRLPGVGSNVRAGTLIGFDMAEGVAVGKRFAETLNVGVGDEIKIMIPIGARTPFGVAPRVKFYKVVAIFESGMAEFDDVFVYMPLPEAQAFFDLDKQASVVEVFLHDPEKIDAVDKTIEAAVTRPIVTVDWRERNKSFFDTLDVERNVMFIILSLIVLVAALNIISGLIMLVTNKSHDIAILRTMGATSGTIMRIFLITGASIGIAGTLAGFLLGLLVAENVEPIRQFLNRLLHADLFPAQYYYLSRLPSVVDPHEVATVVCMTLALSLLATLYPSWRAAKLDPVEALRYE